MAVCLGNQFVPEEIAPARVVARDEDDYVVKVVASNGRQTRLLSLRTMAWVTFVVRNA
jgi:hypothetical protein